MFKKIISLFLSFSLIITQPIFAQGVAQLNLAQYLGQSRPAAIDSFRPTQLRYFSYDSLNNSFRILLDKGDFNKGLSPQGTVPDEDRLKQEARELMDYFLIGLTLPNDAFWVNLRPDSPDNIIDPELEKTDLGRILLEADLQLKKDTAGLTSPQTPEGKAYWDKLYKKAVELFGRENITIPTITRPWIVPGEIIVRESGNSAYIYKANLKVMLEADYLNNQKTEVYSFSDHRLKELNEYSSQIIRETIIPKLTQEINSGNRYAKLRQVYYSLVLSRWFKMRFAGKSGQYADLIDRHNLTNLTAKEPYDKLTYFKQYQGSFAKGEYNLKEPVYTPYGQSIRTYMSGGFNGREISIAGVNAPETAGSSILGEFLKNKPDLVSLEISGNMQIKLAGNQEQPKALAASPVVLEEEVKEIREARSLLLNKGGIFTSHSRYYSLSYLAQTFSYYAKELVPGESFYHGSDLLSRDLKNIVSNLEVIQKRVGDNIESYQKELADFYEKVWEDFLGEMERVDVRQLNKNMRLYYGKYAQNIRKTDDPDKIIRWAERACDLVKQYRNGNIRDLALFMDMQKEELARIQGEAFVKIQDIFKVLESNSKEPDKRDLYYYENMLTDAVNIIGSKSRKFFYGSSDYFEDILEDVDGLRDRLKKFMRSQEIVLKKIKYSPDGNIDTLSREGLLLIVRDMNSLLNSEQVIITAYPEFLKELTAVIYPPRNQNIFLHEQTSFGRYLSESIQFVEGLIIFLNASLEGWRKLPWLKGKEEVLNVFSGVINELKSFEGHLKQIAASPVTLSGMKNAVSEQVKILEGIVSKYEKLKVEDMMKIFGGIKTKKELKEFLSETMIPNVNGYIEKRNSESKKESQSGNSKSYNKIYTEIMPLISIRETLKLVLWEGSSSSLVLEFEMGAIQKARKKLNAHHSGSIKDFSKVYLSDLIASLNGTAEKIEKDKGSKQKEWIDIAKELSEIQDKVKNNIEIYREKLGDFYANIEQNLKIKLREDLKSRSARYVQTIKATNDSDEIIAAAEQAYKLVYGAASPVVSDYKSDNPAWSVSKAYAYAFINDGINRNEYRIIEESFNYDPMLAAYKLGGIIKSKLRNNQIKNKSMTSYLVKYDYGFIFDEKEIDKWLYWLTINDISRIQESIEAVLAGILSMLPQGSSLWVAVDEQIKKVEIISRDYVSLIGFLNEAIDIIEKGLPTSGINRGYSNDNLEEEKSELKKILSIALTEAIISKIYNIPEFNKQILTETDLYINDFKSAISRIHRKYMSDYEYSILSLALKNLPIQRKDYMVFNPGVVPTGNLLMLELQKSMAELASELQAVKDTGVDLTSSRIRFIHNRHCRILLGALTGMLDNINKVRVNRNILGDAGDNFELSIDALMKNSRSLSDAFYLVRGYLNFSFIKHFSNSNGIKLEVLKDSYELYGGDGLFLSAKETFHSLPKRYQDLYYALYNSSVALKKYKDHCWILRNAWDDYKDGPIAAASPVTAKELQNAGTMPVEDFILINITEKSRRGYTAKKYLESTLEACKSYMLEFIGKYVEAAKIRISKKEVEEIAGTLSLYFNSRFTARPENIAIAARYLSGIMENKFKEYEIGKDFEKLGEEINNIVERLNKSEKPPSNPSEFTGGGIDFTDRAMKIGIERMGSFASSVMVLPEIADAAAIDLDKEFKQIQLMVSSGIRPSDTRILEFEAACYYRGEFSQRLGEITACIQQAHFLDERLGRESSEALRLATILPEVM